MSDWFRVEVSDHDGQIVAIEPEMLAGRDIGERETETIHRAIRQLAGFVGHEECRWAEDDDGNWHTGCGGIYILIEGTPGDNRMNFCCYCGHTLNPVGFVEAETAREDGE